jgi:hypothetical protein
MLDITINSRKTLNVMMMEALHMLVCITIDPPANLYYKTAVFQMTATNSFHSILLILLLVLLLVFFAIKKDFVAIV